MNAWGQKEAQTLLGGFVPVRSCPSFIRFFFVCIPLLLCGGSVLCQRGVYHPDGFGCLFFCTNACPLKLICTFCSGFFRSPSIITTLTSSVLYQRGVYHPDGFAREAKYGITTLVTNDEALKKYLDNVIKQLKGTLGGGGSRSRRPRRAGGGTLFVAAVLVIVC